MTSNDRLWACYNCTDDKGMVGLKFRATKPVCPKCGADGSQAEYAPYIVRCVNVHFDPPHPILKNRGTRLRLCDGKSIFEAQKTNVASGDPHSVNCPDCIAHPSFPKPGGELEVPDEADFAV